MEFRFCSSFNTFNKLYQIKNHKYELHDWMAELTLTFFINIVISYSNTVRVKVFTRNNNYYRRSTYK